jgi:hypothetical protein
MGRKTVCISTATGLNVIGWMPDEFSIEVYDVFAVKLVWHPQSGERNFQFIPVKSLARTSTMSRSTFDEMGKSNFSSGVYSDREIAPSVLEAYYSFVDSGQAEEVMKLFNEECGPSQEFLDAVHAQMEAAEACKEKAKPVNEGNLVTGIFMSPKCEE